MITLEELQISTYQYHLLVAYSTVNTTLIAIGNGKLVALNMPRDAFLQLERY